VGSSRGEAPRTRKRPRSHLARGRFTRRREGSRLGSRSPVESPKKDPQKELDIALSELEERVDRLRSLYEQYFMGYEKMEPGVQRKDVERRFTLLRKSQIRNTAQRYRFNVVTQKYNTYVMYWTRICRQIEEGTYKRHIAKAARRFGPDEKRRDPEYSIDVDLGDFEDLLAVDRQEENDMNAILAEADAAADAYSRGVVDTAPPPQDRDPPSKRPSRPSQPIPIQRLTPGTSFAIVGRRETFDDIPDDEATPHPIGIDRRAMMPAPAPTRQAGLPPSAKPRIVVRRRSADAPDPSARGAEDVPHAPPPALIARPPQPSAPQPSAPQPSSPQLAGPTANAANPGGVRPPMRSYSGVEHPPSNSVIRPAAGPSPANRPQQATPPNPAPPESSRRIQRVASGSPTAPVRPAAPSAGRLPTSGAVSTRSPVAAPSPPTVPDDPKPSRRPPPALPSQVKKDI
jgi:hypothetical protein